MWISTPDQDSVRVFHSAPCKFGICWLTLVCISAMALRKYYSLISALLHFRRISIFVCEWATLFCRFFSSGFPYGFFFWCFAFHRGQAKAKDINIQCTFYFLLALLCLCMQDVLFTLWVTVVHWTIPPSPHIHQTCWPNFRLLLLCEFVAQVWAAFAITFELLHQLLLSTIM